MNVRLTPVEQEQIIIKAANNKFDSIEHFPHGRILKNFIYEFVKFCKEQTFTDTFSYRFVSGFAISRLGYNENDDWYERLENKDLAEVIRLCIAYNLIEVTTVTQSVQSQKWTVFYLSRWLCATFKLPLPKGGWRKLSISQLKRWMKNTRIK
jgi:hypothetical protein